MAMTIDQLVTPLTADEAFAELLVIAAEEGLSTTSWQSGQPIHTFLRVISEKFADITVVLAEIAKGGYGDLLPSDSWADLWSVSRFNVTRTEAEAATGQLTLTNTSATEYTKAIGEVIFGHATTGKTYRNVSAIVIPASGTLEEVDIAADEVGTDSNAATGAVTVMVVSLTGVACTNPEPVLGSDDETTPALVTRARTKLSALSPNGPKEAYHYIATTPEFSDVGTAITRTRVDADDATGEVTVYLATANGAAEAGDVVIVQAAFDEWAEPWCTTSTAAAASEVTQAVTYRVWVRGSSLTSTQIAAAVDDALADFFAGLEVGGTVIAPASGKLYVEALRQAIGQATPGIQQVTITVPADDLAMDPEDVAVLGATTSTVTIL